MSGGKSSAHTGNNVESTALRLSEIQQTSVAAFSGEG